ncbi:hypothetical protein FA95DRAFT_648489 [Auriscalpium vulgare]|uniref:Uncharacterized protein n=1 Tax=Auriscalpium vulgare TaxID=40419 RepID=A0ACB8RE02_9AGAM|nr:hypothetical protein FA95DRAFT_648489 [Auriscalpium vulgare]
MSDSDSDSSTSTVIQNPPHGALFFPQDGRRDLIYTRPRVLFLATTASQRPPALPVGRHQALHHAPCPPSWILCSTIDFDIPAPPDVYRTLCGVGWATAIMKHLGLPRFPKDAVCVVPMSDGKGKKGLGFSLGTNHRGIVPAKFHAQLQEVIAKDQPLRWYLDCMHWQWAPRRADGRLVAGA